MKVLDTQYYLGVIDAAYWEYLQGNSVDSNIEPSWNVVDKQSHLSVTCYFTAYDFGQNATIDQEDPIYIYRPFTLADFINKVHEQFEMLTTLKY